MGHPSSEALLLPTTLSVKKNKVNVCEICFRAEQTFSQFHGNENKAQNLFHLIHYDISDPYRMLLLCRAHCFLTIVDDISHFVWVYLMKHGGEMGHLKFSLS